MIKSMTGFGKASAELENKKVNVEVRSLNSKGADISIRISSIYRNYELEIRNELSKMLERGKIDVSVFIESQQTEAPVEINVALAKAYQLQLKNLSKELNENLNDSIYQILKFPDVMKTERKEADEKEWGKVKQCIITAVEDLNKFRLKEGESIQNDFNVRIQKIEDCLSEIKKLDVKRLDGIKKRIKGNLEEILGKDGYDKNRLEQELIFYVEKLDINEEKERLKMHLDHFVSACAEQSSGRKLNFIGQEIGREINTIGSKANDAHIQKLVVLMKDELEKIKEQINNVL
ncbi:MAG: YicC family protein [Sphingobacteriaceae bacterium]|nr:YicC family protein [Sphingobacteriaceae bacterium]